MLKKLLRKKTINSLTKYLDIPTNDDFLVISGREVYYNGKKQDENWKKTISENAESLKKSIIYRCLTNELRKKAQDTIYHKAKTMDDQLVSKTILYTLNEIDKKLDELSEL